MSILNSPLKVNDLELNNRLVMPPMATSKATAEGKITEQICNYYQEKSLGGYIGLIIIEHSYISLEGKASKGQISIADDHDINGLRKLTEIIHENKTKVIAQINHAGGAAKSEITSKNVYGASAFPMPRTGLVPLELSLSDIQKVVTDFTKAALRAKQAGFDGVEIHSAHGYLLNQFYSPLTNKRTDEYGAQTLNGRLKLHFEIIKSIRKAVGDNYPIALRLGACDYMDGGSTYQDSIMAAKFLEQAGIDLLDISGGFCGYIHPSCKEQGYFSEITQGMKSSINIPVLLTGGITDADAAEMLLQKEKADLIGVGRALLNNSLWAKDAITKFSE